MMVTHGIGIIMVKDGVNNVVKTNFKRYFYLLKIQKKMKSLKDFILEGHEKTVKTTAGEFFAWYVGENDWDDVNLDDLEDTISDGDYSDIPGVKGDDNYADLVKYIDKHSKEMVTVEIADSGYGDYENAVTFKDGGEINVFSVEMYK